MVHRIAGIETEYGCLVSAQAGQGNADSWPIRVKNHLFRKMQMGAIDLHYRDYEEPPGNGGFLLNGGRIYIDMGHLEYASPECRSLRDLVASDVAGDTMISQALQALHAGDRVAFIKNNIDHQTGATFGCHENYLTERNVTFTTESLGAFIAFLATRQLFAGAGRVGRTNPLSLEFESPQPANVDFQLSQRADHIVNDIYQWVQFNRAIINARDEPLADPRRYRRLHLLIGDSNMSPFATALKIGTTSLVLTLLESGRLPADVLLRDAVVATREISHWGNAGAFVALADGRTRSALDIQYAFLALAQESFAGRDEETDWVLDSWQFTLEALEALETRPELLLGGVDWVSKRWLLALFRESEGLEWSDPWLQSLDLEYHNIHRERGLFFTLRPSKRIAEWNASVQYPEALTTPPEKSRARGRGKAVAWFLAHPKCSYVINWDSVSIDGGAPLAMSEPLETYEAAVSRLLEK